MSQFAEPLPRLGNAPLKACAPPARPCATVAGCITNPQLISRRRCRWTWRCAAALTVLDQRSRDRHGLFGSQWGMQEVRR